jgi:hypothetical protein
MKLSIAAPAAVLSLISAVSAGGGGGDGGGWGGYPPYGGGSSPSHKTASKCTTTTSATPTPSPYLPGGCKPLGCVADPLTARVLTFNTQVSEAAQTIETCMETCKSMNLKYAGLEYNFECWCGDVFDNTPVPATYPTASCNYPCTGDATEMCGGQEYMNLYDCTDALPIPPTYNECTLLGCYTDVVSARTLPVEVDGGNTNMDPNVCTAACIAAGYRYSGVEYGRECFCGNTIENMGSLAPDGNEQCNMPCAGNPALTCGGKDRLDLYDCAYTPPVTATTSAPEPTGTPKPCPPKLLDDFHGCFDRRRPTQASDFCHGWLGVEDAKYVSLLSFPRSSYAHHLPLSLPHH